VYGEALAAAQRKRRGGGGGGGDDAAGGEAATPGAEAGAGSSNARLREATLKQLVPLSAGGAEASNGPNVSRAGPTARVEGSQVEGAQVEARHLKSVAKRVRAAVARLDAEFGALLPPAATRKALTALVDLFTATPRPPCAAAPPHRARAPACHFTLAMVLLPRRECCVRPARWARRRWSHLR